MFDERAFIQWVESANTDELIQLLSRPTVEEEKALRLHLGDERYQRMHRLAMRQKTVRSLRPDRPKGKVVVLHGIMGGDLSAFDRSGSSAHVWVHVLRLMTGQITRLSLGPDGLAEADPALTVQATGIMKRHYGELLLTLAENWTVRAFWYDWRKDLRVAAAELEARLRGWFAAGEPVHFVAHSMGGLVVRTLIKLYPHRWRSEDKSRLIMLGTPNYGSFLIPQMLTGRADILNWLAMLDFRHNLQEITLVANTFAGAYQLLPSPFVEGENWEALYQAGSYASSFNVSQRHLDQAKTHHEFLQDVVDPERMIYIAGCHQPTYVGVDTNLLKAPASTPLSDIYPVSMEGDGRVPHKLGILKTARGETIPTYYVEEAHADLSSNRQILAAMDELLEKGQTGLLSSTIPTRRQVAETGEDAAELMAEKQEATQQRLAMLIRPLQSRSAQPMETNYISSEERSISRALIYGDAVSSDSAEQLAPIELPFELDEITIRLIQGDITEVDKQKLPGPGPAIDAIGTGHYVGGQLRGSILALDRAISRALLAQQGFGDEVPEPSHTDLLITQYMERGTIQAELGQTFLLDDPRQSPGARNPRRVIAIAGMGLPGRCGLPELTVLAREMCWTLGRLGKRHLATVLVGAGLNNLSVNDSISAWIRGLKHAITGASTENRQRHLQVLTFVEIDPHRVIEMDQAISAHKRQLEKRLKINYQSLSGAEIKQLEAEARRRLEKALSRPASKLRQENPFPTRMTVNINDRSSYCFGAITQTASVPEREIPLDPRLIIQANDELAAAWGLKQQLELGRFMARLLIPADFRSQLSSEAPVVLMLDATTARIHWELLVHVDSDQPAMVPQTDQTDDEDNLLQFLGTSRGLTRQLRTTFAPPPEPPPPYHRLMRVLVVADPAEDAPLPGAEEEGIMVADLFEQFNTLHASSKNRVEIIRLFGPREATRTAVLRQLILRSYDVFHFAGHCVFDKEDPSASGWIFSNGERLSVNELNRIDRIPSFIFSNACESGITPDRAGERTAALAPSFAEAFFARGVSNFVCTAWPVDDLAAREFALRLYEGMLGFERSVEANEQRLSAVPQYQPRIPLPMHQAMTEARKAIAVPPYDFRTWGAYQHYGNPYFRFFDTSTMEGGDPLEEGTGDKAPKKRRRKSK